MVYYSGLYWEGKIDRFYIDAKQFAFYGLTKEARVPVAIGEDKDSRLWLNDHASNLFFMFDPLTKDFVKYSISLPTSGKNTTTLPYCNMIRDDYDWRI